jgi:hypothetical protein
MTEQTKPGDAAKFADTVGPLFNMWAYRERRECLRADLIEAGPAEMVGQFRKTAHLLDGLATHAEHFIGFGAACVLVDARRIAEEACEIAEDHAGEEAFG